VNLKEKVTVTIPVIPIGEPIAVAQNIGILEQPLSEVEIEALPTDLIENIEYNVESLAELDQAVYMADIMKLVPSTVTVVADDPENLLVFKIGSLMTAEMEETLEAAEAEAEAANEEVQAEEAVGEGEEAKEAIDETPAEESINNPQEKGDAPAN